MFFTYPDIQEGSLAPDKADRVIVIAEALPTVEIIRIERKFVTLRGPTIGDMEADVTPTGVTVYLGGFDWVTFPTPPHVLQEFPDLIPLPSQSYASVDTVDLLEDGI